jgi:hypothetical protein
MIFHYISILYCDLLLLSFDSCYNVYYFANHPYFYRVAKKHTKYKFSQFCNESEKKRCLEIFMKIGVKLFRTFDLLIK